MPVFRRPIPLLSTSNTLDPLSTPKRTEGKRHAKHFSRRWTHRSAAGRNTDRRRLPHLARCGPKLSSWPQTASPNLFISQPETFAENSNHSLQHWICDPEAPDEAAVDAPPAAVDCGDPPEPCCGVGDSRGRAWHGSDAGSIPGISMRGDRPSLAGSHISS